MNSKNPMLPHLPNFFVDLTKASPEAMGQVFDALNPEMDDMNSEDLTCQSME